MAPLVKNLPERDNLDQNSSQDSKDKEKYNGLGHFWKMKGKKKEETSL